MQLNRLAVALFTFTVGSPLVIDTAAYASQPRPERPWIVWQKVSACAENRVDWMTVAQENPTSFGLDHFEVADGYVQTFAFDAAMSQMNTLREGARYTSACCRTWSVWEQSGTRQLGVMHNATSVAPGWQLAAGDMCCEEAMDRANIAGGCGAGAGLSHIQRNPSPPPTKQRHGAPLFQGAWQSSWGNLYLTQTGSSVSGTYDHDGGRITGTLSGDVLTYRWSQKSGRQGVGTFTLAGDGKSFSGPWSYTNADGSLGSGGTWSATRL